MTEYNDKYYRLMNKENRWFRIRYGYKNGEFISVPEDKLAKAIYSKQTGQIFAYGDQMIDGREIKSITPDYHKHTGWNEWYEPKEREDQLQIERDCPDYTGCIDKATDIAIQAITDKNPKLLDTDLLLIES